MPESTRCPCGRAALYTACCGRVHASLASAATAEDVMRARYSAYVLGLEPFLLDSWHPRTRPRTLGLDPAMRWTGLVVEDTTAGGVTDTVGQVRFVAAFARAGQPGVLAEHSAFQRLPQGWVYVGVVEP